MELGTTTAEGEQMTVSLEDVANAAGVSKSTASRALTGSPLVSEATRDRVRAAARQLNYRVNRTASALRSKQSHLIGMVLNNLINASFHTIAEVTQRIAARHGYQVILCITDGDRDREKDLMSMLIEHNVAGMIVAGSGQNGSLSNSIQQQGIAVVNIVRSVANSTAPTVLGDDFNGAREATRYLLSLGHERIGYIGGPQDVTSGHERFGGYRAALADYGQDVSLPLVVKGPFDPTFGSAAVEQLLSGPIRPTALFAANHEAVFGVLPALASRRILIPEELSLVCYEDMEWLALWQPPVTVVDNDAHGLATLAMQLLLNQLSDTTGPASSSQQHQQTYRIGARLVLRDSCRQLPGDLRTPPRN